MAAFSCIDGTDEIYYDASPKERKRKKRMVENTFECNLQSEHRCGCIDSCKHGRPIIPDTAAEVKYEVDDHLPF